MEPQVKPAPLSAPAVRPEILHALGAPSPTDPAQSMITALALGALVVQLAVIAALDGVVPTPAIVGIAIFGGLGTTVLAHSLQGKRLSPAR